MPEYKWDGLDSLDTQIPEIWKWARMIFWTICFVVDIWILKRGKTGNNYVSTFGPPYGTMQLVCIEILIINKMCQPRRKLGAAQEMHASRTGETHPKTIQNLFPQHSIFYAQSTENVWMAMPVINDELVWVVKQWMGRIHDIFAYCCRFAFLWIFNERYIHIHSQKMKVHQFAWR